MISSVTIMSEERVRKLPDSAKRYFALSGPIYLEKTKTPFPFHNKQNPIPVLCFPKAPSTK